MAYTDTHKFHDDLSNATRFCVALGKLRRSLLGSLVRAEDDTGTATFIEHQGSTFCLTAQHVIEALDPNGTQGVLLLKSPGHVVLGPFSSYVGQLGDAEKDIAISCISEKLPAYLGKEALELSLYIEPSQPVAAAMAVGFPTKSKSAVNTGPHEYVRMPGVCAVAESIGSSITASQMQFRTETPVDPEHDLSGMSGGPVFWSSETGNSYGLLGLVKEAMSSDPFDVEGMTTHNIHYVVERTPLDQLRENLERVKHDWPEARAKLAEKIKSGYSE